MFCIEKSHKNVSTLRERFDLNNSMNDKTEMSYHVACKLKGCVGRESLPVNIILMPWLSAFWLIGWVNRTLAGGYTHPMQPLLFAS